MFLIGARFNSSSAVLKDLGPAAGILAMLDYLVAHPEKGLLGYEMGLRYRAVLAPSSSWAFAKDADDPHLRPGGTSGGGLARAVGPASHETFLVRAGE